MEKPNVSLSISLGRGYELGISTSNRLIRINTNSVGGPTFQDLGSADEENFQAFRHALMQLEELKTFN